MTRAVFSAPCYGCAAPLQYLVERAPGGAPEVLPPRYSVAYRDGHLCARCADRVEHMLREVAVDRCPDCGAPTHATESDDTGRCAACRATH